ncbi:MAG: threonine--tRNA ligase [Euryarchaeota archaeon]|nr:threonine--tRNA ligase [Euryarchaeota archaeon]
MRLLLIHSDYMRYETKDKAMKAAEDIPGGHKKGSMDEVLVAFASVEERDTADHKAAAAVTAASVKEVLAQVRADKVMLYPYAHLSPSLADPASAMAVLVETEKLLRADGINVERSPFGWYKAFQLSCKGHPLSELSREVAAGEEKVTREEVVKGIKKQFVVLTPEGKEYPLEMEKAESDPNLEKHPSLRSFILTEEARTRKTEEPPSVKAMQRLELVDYEEASDSGHFRLYPKGHLVFHLLQEWARQLALERLNAIQIDTPILYDWTLPDIQAQGRSFHERHYVIKTDEKRQFVLRFAGDFGLFRMMAQSTLSYRHLPIKVYEFSKSFRLEQRGELTGLKRLRAFHMPDIHYFTKDLDQGWDVFMELFQGYTEYHRAIGAEYAIAFRIVDEFYGKYKDRLVGLLKYAGKPALIEILSQRKHYWVVKYESQALDAQGGAVQLNTVQLDVEDAERYGILYTDSDGQKKPCIIGHCSVGSLERWIYTLLENALKMPKPELPYWLSPTQVRLLPVAGEHVQDCEALARKLHARVDIDDRDEKVGRKIRDAEKEWINLIIVVGEKEKASGKFPVRFRTGEVREFTVDELRAEIARLQGEYPYDNLPLPVLMSRRPIFRG